MCTLAFAQAITNEDDYALLIEPPIDERELAESLASLLRAAAEKYQQSQPSAKKPPDQD